MKKKKKKAAPKKDPTVDIWTRCCALKVRRKYVLTEKLRALDPGVNFFVLMLEQLGCKATFSHEGNPGRFSIGYVGPAAVGTAIVQCSGGIFRVEFADEVNTFVIYRHADSVKCDGKRHDRSLIAAAKRWQRGFGSLKLKHANARLVKKK